VKAAGYRAEADLRNEKVGFKIREAEKAKIPYMLVVGDRETQSGTVSVRGRAGSNLGSMSVAAVLDLLRTEAAQPVPLTTTT
jgi:threonyl-tRNA synthetase